MIDTTYSQSFNLDTNNTLEIKHIIPFGSTLKFSWSGADATDGTIDLQLGSEGNTQNATNGVLTLSTPSGTHDIQINSSFLAFKFIYTANSNTNGTYKIELIRGNI